MRITFRRLGLIAAIAVAGCHDPTAPEGPLDLIVEPNTARIDENGLVRVLYTIRNSSALPLVIGVFPDMQAELSPGTWTDVESDPNALYVQEALGGSQFAANHSVQRTEVRRLTPGRYRLRMPYWSASSTGTKASPAQEALSNAFDVVP